MGPSQLWMGLGSLCFFLQHVNGDQGREDLLAIAPKYPQTIDHWTLIKGWPLRSIEHNTMLVYYIMCKWTNIDLQTRVQWLSPVGNGNFFHFQLVAKKI
jgi:hypothetical protein